MKTFVKALLIAGAVAASAFTTSAPASAQRYYDERPSFGFYVGSGAPPVGAYADFGYRGRHCRPVRQVWFDRWGRRHVTLRPVCRPFASYRNGWSGRW